MEQAVDSIIRPSIEHMGFRLVRVKMMDVEGKRTLQIMAERENYGGMNVDDCSEISHTVSALLDVHDPIEGAYHLEVTSPGIDRPLVTEEDFERYAGFDAKLETRVAIAGRKRYRGQILTIENGNVAIQGKEETYTVRLEDIATAKLILTDALIDAYQKGKVTH